MSVYACFAVWFVETRKKGEKGHSTAVAGAVGALSMVVVGQIVAHWIAAGYMYSSMTLTAAVSTVPGIVAGHVAHMIIRARVPGDARPQEPEEQEDQSHETGEAPVQPTLDGECEADEVTRARKRRPGRPGPSLDELRAAAEAIAEAGEKVTGPALAKFMGRDRRQGSRYLTKLNKAA
ncbi:hypothetical protein OG711_15580 [Streptomyces uncialis]|uniref:hypothetical protein n=2 Tax=Streptomyces TaxID=1883 RepID=UPI002E3475B8|nr:hypothetical protein [Streptomyces uncialis]